MRPPTFLDGDGFRLTPVEPADTSLVAGHPHPGPGEDEILLAVRASDVLVCVVALAPIRWPTRTTAIRFGPAPPTDPQLVRAILTTVTRYALDELGLHQIDLCAEGVDASSLGYAPVDAGHWQLKRSPRLDAPTL